jgi:ribose transport system ATP-binding protein
VTATTLSMHGICKDFPGVRALDAVDLDVSAGEVHGVVGANGAGKSTLVKILSGLYQDYRGSVRVEGREAKLSSPILALKCCISVLQQEPELAWNLSVSENIFLADPRRSIRRFGLLDRDAMTRECARLLEQYGAGLAAERLVSTLNRGQIQILQIVKVLSHRPKVLVLDEPTTALTSEERDRLFLHIRDLAQEGTAIVFISHDIEDVFAVCQRVTVLRDGRKAAEAATDNATPRMVLQEMFGSTLSYELGDRNKYGPPALRLEGVRTANGPQVSLTVHKGEVLGIAGQAKTVKDVLRTVYGMVPRKAGVVRVHDVQTSISTPQDAIRAGIGFLPEDRVRDGLFVDLSLRINITLLVLRQFTRYGILLWKRPRELAARSISDLRIRATGPDAKVAVLSGGNRQKTLFARWLCAGPDILLLEEPTAGMDVGAKHEILKIIRKLGDQGTAILMASNDIDELLHLCDRIVVLGKREEAYLFEVDEGVRPLIVAAMAGLQEKA